MGRETRLLLVVSLIIFLALTLCPMETLKIKAQPRSDLDIIWYTSPDAAFTALVNDEVDTIQWALTKEQKEAVEANPDLQIAAYSENGMFEFDINNNATIMDYPTSLNPMSVEECRQAIAYLIDKDYIISDILEYFGSRIDAPVAYPQTEGWVYEPEWIIVDLETHHIHEHIGEKNGRYGRIIIKNIPIQPNSESIVVEGKKLSGKEWNLRYPVDFGDKDYVICYDNGWVIFKEDYICKNADVTYTYQKSVVTYDWNHNGIIEPDEDNYPFKYNPDFAAILLASLGFNDTDGNGYLNYPNDPMWMDAAGKDTTEMPLKICIRQLHTHRREAGRYLYHQLEGDPAVAGDSPLALANWPEGFVGGDWDTTDEAYNQPREVLSPIVFGDRNYHIYTGGWSFGRFPTYLFFLHHSWFWYPWGPNYVNPNGQFDYKLEEIWNATSIEEAQYWSKEYTREHVLSVVNIPLWSYTSYVAWSKNLSAVVNMNAYGLVNDYTFLNAYRADDPNASIRVGCVSTWNILNILYSQWYHEYAFLDCIYTSLMSVNPYDLTVDQPWAAQDWEVGTWVDPRDGKEKTVVTYYLRPDVGCAAPVEGNFSAVFTAYDYEFTVWYNYAYDDSWQWSSFMDVHHTEIIDPFTVKVYFDDQSMWFVYKPTYPLLGPNEILVRQLCEVHSVTFTGADLAEVAPGYFEYQFTTDQVVQVINATVNDVPIEEGVDFYIRAGHDTYCHNVFVNLTAFAPTDIITICYYAAIPGGADGTYLGGNLGYSWEDTMYAYGLYYPVSISTTSASLNRNPYFFLETPLLGEIDWRWYWDTPGGVPGWENSGRDYGYYKIDILDVIFAAAAYCTRGDGVYNPDYMPGADLDATDLGHIGILDLVTITTKYGKRFGHPPSCTLIAGGGSEATALWPLAIGIDPEDFIIKRRVGAEVIEINTLTGEIKVKTEIDKKHSIVWGYFLDKQGKKLHFKIILSIPDAEVTVKPLKKFRLSPLRASSNTKKLRMPLDRLKGLDIANANFEVIFQKGLKITPEKENGKYTGWVTVELEENKKAGVGLATFIGKDGIETYVPVGFRLD